MSDFLWFSVLIEGFQELKILNNLELDEVVLTRNPSTLLVLGCSDRRIMNSRPACSLNYIQNLGPD